MQRTIFILQTCFLGLGCSIGFVFEIAGCQPAKLFLTEYGRFLMIKNVNNQYQKFECIQILA